MPVTKYILAEQVLFRLYGGVPDSSSPVQYDDVYKAIEQKINSLFKLRHFDITLPSGETMPDNAMIATYENVAVTSFGEKSKSTLPAIPISLPKDIGICWVYDPNFPDMPFVPLQRGFTALLRTDKLLSDIMGQISYERKNNVLIYNKDLTLLGIDVVTMELAVFDMASYSITDTLPIPADFEDTIVNQLVAQFSPVTPETGQVNDFTNFGQNQPTNIKQ